MNVHAAGGGERMLRRLVALLVAFALLAERVAGRSAPVRCLVLWILRRAETVAEAYVFEATGAPPPALDALGPVGNDAGDALRLAARFQVLAAMLAALLPSGGWPRVRFALRVLVFRDAVAGCAPRAGGWAPGPNDTS